MKKRIFFSLVGSMYMYVHSMPLNVMTYETSQSSKTHKLRMRATKGSKKKSERLKKFHFCTNIDLSYFIVCIIYRCAYLSNVNSSSIFKSHAIYSRAASVILGHQLKSSALNFCRFSAINSIPSSVILLHPDNDNTVKCGSECTARKKKMKYRKQSTNITL